MTRALRCSPATRPARWIGVVARWALAGAVSLAIQACGAPDGTYGSAPPGAGPSSGYPYGGSSGGGSSGAPGSGESGKVPMFGPCQCSLLYDGASCMFDNTCANDLSCDNGLCRPSCSPGSSCPYGGACVQQTIGSCDDANQDNCTTDGDCAQGVACLGAGGGFCADPCTPLPDSCGAGASCSLTEGQPDCLPRAADPTQAECASDSECAAGTTCTIGVGCEPWCRMDTPGDCAAGAVCIALPGPVTAGGSTYGACRAACHPGDSCANGGTCAIVTASDPPFVDCVPPTSPYASGVAPILITRRPGCAFAQAAA